MRKADCPVLVPMAGSFAETPERTVHLHAIAHRAARTIYEPQAPIKA